MNVLSLFDGMSCGMLALERANIKVNKYYSSEIDKHAITVSEKNYPNIIRLGDVRNIDTNKLNDIDMVIGGSPCQSFSFAGRGKGMSTKDEQKILTLNHYLELKNQEYEFDGQSYLFWEFVRIVNELKPKYFLLENVVMANNWELVISKTLKVNPIKINSSLVSAQNRNRLYWTNIGLKPGGLFGDLVSTINQPKDKGLILKDILQDDVDTKYNLSDKSVSKITKYNNWNENEKPKSQSLIAGYNKIGRDNTFIRVHNMQQRSKDRPSIKKDKNAGGTGHLTREDGKTYCLDTQQSNAVEIRKVNQLSKSKESNGKQPYQHYRFYGTNGLNPSLTSSLPGGSNLIINNKRVKSNLIKNINHIEDKTMLDSYNQTIHKQKSITVTTRVSESNSTHIANVKQNELRLRKLTPIECERLQTVPDNYTNYVSDTQRYRMLGNGWTIDVIAHIFKYID